MRLTTVARMSVPNGVVHQYAIKVTPVQEGSAPLSFDQARHAGLGRRAGSWMAVAFRLPKALSVATDRDLIAAAWLAVINRHGTLRTVIDDSGEELRLNQVTVEPGGWSLPDAAVGEDPREVLRRVFDQACCPFSRPAHALCLIVPVDECAAAPVTVVIGLDHSHVDAWSLLVLLRDFDSFLNDHPAGGPPRPAASFAEHTAALAARPPAPPEVHRRWAEILARGGGEMPVFPMDLGRLVPPPSEVVEVRDVVEPSGVAGVERAAAATGVRMIALVVAEMTAVFRNRAGVGLRAVLPVHSRHEERWHDSVGWFITNSVLECEEPDPRACSADVRAAVKLGSYALGPILEPFGGMPHTPGMFAVSWLDHRRLPVDVDQASAPQHVSASIRTNGVMVWFVINEAGLHVRCRYPDTPQARESVGGWLDDLCCRIKSLALQDCTPR